MTRYRFQQKRNFYSMWHLGKKGWYIWCIVNNFILHFDEVHIGSSIRYKTTLFVNYFLKRNKVKRILISLNRCSEYSLFSKTLRRHIRFCDTDQSELSKKSINEKVLILHLTGLQARERALFC